MRNHRGTESRPKTVLQDVAALEVISRQAVQSVNFMPLVIKAIVALLLRNNSCFLTPVAGFKRNF